MQPKILFVVISAVSRPETVDQLAAALAPHRVLVHHDFSQTPVFPLTADNVLLVPDPRRTGWATFGFVDAIFHSLAYAVRHLEFDYLQLLSPTCLPIRPMAEFESRVADGADAHFGAIDLMADLDCLMWVGYRAFTPVDSFLHRVMRRLCHVYFHGSRGRRDVAGVWLRSGGGRSIPALAARCALELLSKAAMARHPFRSRTRLYYGSVWFGARRAVVEGLVEGFARPGVRDYFSKLRIAEEFLVPTLLMQLAGRKGPLLHYIKWFEEAHPLPIGESQLEMLRSSQAYFARKFPDDPAAPIRLRVLQELVRVDEAIPSAPQAEAEHATGSATTPELARDRTVEPVAALGAAAVLELRRGWQSFSGAGRRFRH